MTDQPIKGFSKLSKEEKLKWASGNSPDPKLFENELMSYWHSDPGVQKVLDEFSENTISNYCLPYGVAPNFLINGKTYAVPMVIEESSVVAAAASSAGYWFSRGGFTSKVLSVEKTGQVYFRWTGKPGLILDDQEQIIDQLTKEAGHLTVNMEKRGGGIKGISITGMSDCEPDLYKLNARFNTVDSMGANFINSCLESFGRSLNRLPEADAFRQSGDGEMEVVMAILSNYTPSCLVECTVHARTKELEPAGGGLDTDTFARRFRQAVKIAREDPYRAVTHNKGIFNGIDAVVLATGNDFRAVEAGGHAYAAREGRYSSLTFLGDDPDHFTYTLRIPLAVGTVGGLTTAHPLARRSMEMLGNPDVQELMGIVAAAGLANNYAAIRSLVTTGIQKGHMKMHLSNILNRLEATAEEKDAIHRQFKHATISFSAVSEYLRELRSGRKNGH